MTDGIREVKLIHRTSGGSLVRSSATLRYMGGRIEFLKSPFALKDEIKAMTGSKWHGYDPENPRKIWSVTDCQRNRFQLGYLMGEDVYAWFDREVTKHEYTRPLMPHQKELADYFLTYHYGIMAAEMGCIDGEALVQIERHGSVSYILTLKELFYRFHGGKRGHRSWGPSVTKIKGLHDRVLGLNVIKNVLYKGVRQTHRIETQSGKILRLTADHLVCVNAGGNEQYKTVEQLRVGDTVLVKAPVHQMSLAKISSPPPDILVKQATSGGGICAHGAGGYVRVCGLPNHPRSSGHGAVYEHLLVMEEHLGRYLTVEEEVHHINLLPWDNRLDNLRLLTKSEHRKIHNTHINFAKGAATAIYCYADDTITKIVRDAQIDVYDVVCEGPYHNFLANGIVVHNCGKTLAVQEVIERSGIKEVFWIGPKTSLPNIRREFRLWNLDSTINVEMLNYEALKRVIDEWEISVPVPQFVVCDESSRCKGATSQRSVAVQQLADMVREKYGFEGYVIEMSGTPSPKSPLDWWRQTEIAWPGFLKEGSPKALEARLAFLVDQQFDAGVFKKRIGWKDDEQKCNHCGLLEEDGPHRLEDDGYHPYESSINEVSYLYERLKGLVIVKHKKDCLSLPDKRYRKIVCKPNSSTLRAAQAITQSAVNTITGLTLLRELSDGFQYKDIPDGMTKCPHCKGTKQVDAWHDPDDETRLYLEVNMLRPEVFAKLVKQTVDCPRCDGKGEIAKTVRVAKEVPCPKDKVLRELLDECEETGRIVVFAGFTGSVDHIVNLCHKEGWDVVRCDGRGWQVTKHDGTAVLEGEPLDYWSDIEEHPRIAFVSHPESGGMSLTLVESRMAVYWSNSFKPEYRGQSEDRIHRIGMDLNKGCVIVDLIHLPSDERVLEVIRENRRLELMTLGEVLGDINWDISDEGKPLAA